jgi:hypothetical protein
MWLLPLAQRHCMIKAAMISIMTNGYLNQDVNQKGKSRPSGMEKVFTALHGFSS